MQIAVALVTDGNDSAADSSIVIESDEAALNNALGRARERFENEGGDMETPHLEITFLINVEEPVHQPIRLELHNGRIRLLSAK
jgi:hypothetical protein